MRRSRDVNRISGTHTSQHRKLVAQHQQFGVLGRRTPRQQCKPAQHLTGKQVQQSQGDAPIIAAPQRR
jgi:hypothetical protein